MDSIGALTLPLPTVVTPKQSYLRNESSLGQAGNVNQLFARARGERLVLMHDDDFLLPGALTAMDGTRSTAEWVR